MDSFFASWDGQTMHIKRMIREIHARQSVPHFKYEDLLKALESRGFRVDPVTFMVSQTNLVKE
jgi:hypothetical protein